MPIKSAPLKNQVALLIAQGLALHHQGKFIEAQIFYEKVLVIQPNHFDALQLLGTLSIQTQQFTNAVDFLTKALQIQPNNGFCNSNLGTALIELEHFEEALVAFNIAICLNPDNSQLYFNQGVVLQKLKRFHEALVSYDKSIIIKPDSPDAYANKGNTLKELQLFEEALANYEQAISLNPNFAEDYSNRGVALQELNRFDEALESYDRAIAIKPDYADAYSNRGNALKELKRFDEALESYDRAIAIKPNYADAYYNRGITLQELNRLDEALKNYDRAVAIKPDHASAHWNQSLCNLLGGNFKDGLQGYEWRWKSEDMSKTAGIRNFSQPLWLGEESLKDKTILLYAEQGLGDTIQFCRFVSLVTKLGAKVILEVQRPLVKLLKDLNGVTQIIAKCDDLPKFDYQCPLLSLPLAFKTELHNIPTVLQHITGDSGKVTSWQAKLGEKSNLRVGLVWSGNTIHKNDHNRSLTLSQLLPHLPSDIEYVCLQKELRDIDKELLAKHTEIKYFGDALGDFTDTAALCELMDVVISVDTSVVHLAGSLVKPTWVLLPYSPDWRWLLDRVDSPWYPSAKLYRQEKIGDWDGALVKVKADLEKLVNLTHIGH